MLVILLLVVMILIDDGHVNSDGDSNDNSDSSNDNDSGNSDGDNNDSGAYSIVLRLDIQHLQLQWSVFTSIHRTFKKTINGNTHTHTKIK